MRIQTIRIGDSLCPSLNQIHSKAQLSTHPPNFVQVCTARVTQKAEYNLEARSGIREMHRCAIQSVSVLTFNSDDREV